MEFRVLGPLEAGDGQESLALGPRKQRALLARLLLDAGRTVSVERLVDDLWGEDVPDTAVKMVQIYVSGLRKALGADSVVTRASGYCLELGPDDELDLHRFERLAAAGRTALAQDDPAVAAERFREALALWRGPAFAEFAAEPFARAEADRLDELQLAALEDRIEGDLALGRAPDLVGELEALVSRHPLRERPQEQLMLALHRSGRQGDALAAYRRFRATLADELGLDPSPRLRALEQAILTHDPALHPRRRAEEIAPEVAAPELGEAPPGRAAELRALRSALRAAAAGSRRLVLVAGEPGIGKTTLVEALLGGAGEALVIGGHCVDQRGAGEPYLPLLDGLGRAARDEAVAATLAARAPSWLAQLPWIGAEAPVEHAHGATRERMLREMVEALEALAVGRTVIVVIEDLQWADPSTLELVGALMRRRHPARLLVVVTGDGRVPLVDELRLRGTAQEVVPAPLDPPAAAAAFELQEDVAAELVRRGGGNPLFMRHLAEHLRSTGSVQGVPDTLRAALHARLAGLDDGERAVLEAAAVEGLRFTGAGVSAAIGRPVESIAAGSIVQSCGSVEWPDGTHTAAFEFVHALHRDVLLETIPAARRAELHRHVGERMAAAFGAAPETAPAIAHHFAAGRHPAPAVRYLRLAAAQCVARRAHHEAIGHLEQALGAAADLPDGPLRRRLQTELLSDLGQSHVAIEGWSSPAAIDCLERARATAETLSDREPLAAVLLALATLHEVRGEPAPALDAAGAGAGLADEGVDGAELLACALFHQGAFTRALEQAERGAAAFENGDDSGHHDTFPATLGENAGVACHDWAALSLWFLGRAGESMRRARRALELCEQPARAYGTAAARAQLAALHACRNEPAEAMSWAQATVDAARDRGYAYRVAMGRVLRGWAMAADGRADGVHEIACGLEASRATGAHLEDPFYLGLLADAHLRTGAHEAGLAAVDEALAIARRERAHYYDAELHRLRGGLLHASGRPADDAEASIREALAIARDQGARSLELRATLSLVGLLSERGRAAEGKALVAVAHEALADEDTPDVRAAAALLADEPAPGGARFERRRITVLAWDIKGVGRLAEQLDPEGLGRVVAACHAAAREVAAAEGGHVATEDEAGGMIYFGYPRALEDAAVRAVRAGRTLAGTATVIGDRLSAGVDTGQAVVGQLRAGALAMGQTPRTAWQLAVAAPPGEVVVSDATRALCEGYFGLAPLGDGHRITGETGARSRVAASGGELSPLVGRRHELALLASRWEQVAEGLGQAVVITGEAGIGKSRLVRELAARIEPEGAVLELQCSDARASSALHPVADHFRRRLAERSGGVEALLAEAGVPVADSSPVVAALLGLPGGPHLEPEALKRRTADVVVSYVLAHAENAPVLAVVEDLHWADPSTLELFDELLDAIGEARVLLVATSRASLRAPWAPRGHAGHLALAPCTRREAEQLIAHVVPAPLPADVERAIIERGDGVPLFIEELARAADAGGAHIPATLDDSLMGRLDRLGPAAKAVARLGALIGREFPRDVLAAASDLPAGELERGLDQLLAAELLRRRGRPPAVRYAFRHALLQEAVTHALPGGERRALHLRIARAAERVAPELARTQPDTLARHLEEAGEPARAVSYRYEAGRLALARSANAEAVDHLTRALADLEGRPDDGERDGFELDLRILLGSALLPVRGYASLEVADCYARARELCRRTGDDARLMPVLYGLWVNAFVRARHERVLELGVELRELAEHRDPGVLIVAERAVGWPLVCMGRFEEARECLDRIPALHDPGDPRPLHLLYGGDPAVAGLATGAWALWGCGEEEDAEARAEEAIALARETEHPLTLAYALGAGSLLAAFRRDTAAARARAVEAIAVTDAFRLPLWRAWSLYALGSAELDEGDPERAAVTVRAGLQGARETAAALYEPFALTVLAEAESRAGRRDVALRALEEAGAAARRSGEVFWQPRTRRLQDELLARHG